MINHTAIISEPTEDEKPLEYSSIQISSITGIEMITIDQDVDRIAMSLSQAKSLLHNLKIILEEK